MVESQVFAFSNDGGDAIERSVDVEPIPVEDVDLDTYFEIGRCVTWIKNHSFNKVCLQFPDELLSHSLAVAGLLEERTGQRMHILADSTYGSCCVDEKTAKHVGGDSLIHFGSSCLYTTKGIPVLFVFTRPTLDISQGLRLFRDTFQPEELVVLLFDVIYEAVATDLCDKLVSTHPRLVLARLVLPGDCTAEGGVVIHGRKIEVGAIEEVRRVFYVGSSERTLLNFLLGLPLAQFLLFNPKTGAVEERRSQLTRLLMQRNYYMERLKDASTVGILVGTLAVEQYLDIIKQIKDTLTRAQKKFYVVSIGDITPPKLANFPDIQVFVLVACAESGISQSRDFFQPIVTPYELELSLNTNRNWTGDYVLDFRLLLPGGGRHVALECAHSPDVSLITGGMRVMSSWKGLDAEEKGQEQVLEGRSGIAQSYSDEPIPNTTT